MNGTVSAPNSTNKSHGINFQGKPWTLFALIFVIEAMQISKVAGFHGYVPYYRSQWAINYTDGFVRRGLLGSILHLVHLDNSLLIAACGWAVTLTLFLLVAEALLHLLAPLEPLTRNVLLVALLLSPVTMGILAQTTGDPIQLMMLVYVVLTMFMLKPDNSSARVFLVFLVLGVVSVLVHEASIFFIGPALVLMALIRRSRIDWTALLGYAFSALPAVLLVIHFTRDQATAHGVNSLLAEENGAHFHHGLAGFAIMLRNGLGALLLPSFFAVLLSRLLPTRRFLAFFLPLFLSAPLWVIAHDWGRFSSYSFMLTVITLAGVSTAPQVRKLPLSVAGILLILSGLTTAVPDGTYTIKGVGADNYTLIVTGLLCSIATWNLKQDRHGSGSHLNESLE